MPRPSTWIANVAATGLRSGNPDKWTFWMRLPMMVLRSLRAMVSISGISGIASLRRRRWRQDVHEGRDGEDRFPETRFSISLRGLEAIPGPSVAVGPEQANMIFERRAGLGPAENTQRLGTPGGEPRRHSVAHEEIQPLARGRNGLVHCGESCRF